LVDKEVHLKDYISAIRNHIFVIVISFLLVFGTALIVSLYMPRIYQASAVIEVQDSTSASGLSSLMQNVISKGVDQVSMETICKRFSSNSILYETIHNLKSRYPLEYDDLESPESLIPKISAKIIPDTKMIEVSVKMNMDEGRSERAAIIANELVSVMQKQRSAKADAEMMRRWDFINDRLKVAESEIIESEEDIRQFLKENGNSIVWTANINNMLSRISDLIKLKESGEYALIAEEKKLDQLSAKLENEPDFIEYSKTFARNPLLDKYRTDLADLQKQYVAAMASELGVENPRVKSIKAQIDEVIEKTNSISQEEIASKTQSINPMRQSIMSEIINSQLRQIAYETQLNITKQTLDRLNAEKDRIFSEMPQNQYQLDRINREVEYKGVIYRNLLDKKLDAEILAIENKGDESRIKGGIEIVDIAEPNIRPISPRVKFIGAISALIGIFAGLILAFLGEYLFGFQKPENC